MENCVALTVSPFFKVLEFFQPKDSMTAIPRDQPESPGSDWFGPVPTGLDQLKPASTSLDRFKLAWTGSNQLGPVQTIWTCSLRLGQVQTSLNQFKPVETGSNQL
ncbi:Hypothetical predicted protein [Podarcis lilfordi]|uniref:Uncharacterized protein n=2 Tax=Podarcis lilfordi TaxID=74358 RepID=A0AA35JNI6_9SAUR|nr:Hypothetical predicted protein [Podarcis lilfordi]